MQKLINGLAVASFIISAGIVSGGVYLYTQKDAIIDNVKSQVTGAVTDMIMSQFDSPLPGGEDASLPTELPF